MHKNLGESTLSEQANLIRWHYQPCEDVACDDDSGHPTVSRAKQHLCVGLFRLKYGIVRELPN